VYCLPNAEVSTIALRPVTSRSSRRKPGQDLAAPGRPWPRRRCRGHTLGQRCGDADAHHVDDACIHEAASAPAALQPCAPWTGQPAVDGSGPAEGSAIDVQWRPMTGRLTVGGACSALPAEDASQTPRLPDGLLSHHPSSTRPRLHRLLTAVMSQTAALPSDVPLELSKLRVERTSRTTPSRTSSTSSQPRAEHPPTRTGTTT